jgi:hypothetical protein
MAFNPLTFIRTYQSTDKFITLEDTDNKSFRVLNICQHKKISINNRTLSILQEGGNVINLGFQNSSDAIVARNTLQSAIDLLSDNCKIDATIIPPGTFIVESITYSQYKTLQSTNTLGIFQWYDVSDVNNDLGLGSIVYRVLSINTHDSQPKGTIFTTKQTVCFNCIDDIIVSLEDGENKNVAYNDSKIIQTDSEYLEAKNKSTLTSNNSFHITANNDSIVEVINSNHIQFNDNCRMIVKDSNNCSFQNIISSNPLFEYSNYSEIIVNKNETLGKQGKEILSTNGTITLTSYKNTILQLIDNITGIYTINFLNEFKQCNSEFDLQIKNIDFDVIIKDSVSSNTLITLTSKDSNTKVRVKWNVATQLFEAVQEVNKLPRRDILTVTSNGQTTFVNAFTKIPYSPSTVLLFINGKQETSFSISSTTMIWTNTDYILETTDEVILQYI